ncbi:MAG: transposase [Firmicutes bacterium HGW-Firmicutes-18]|nr:MAG: transposase [Firmicutes bacterium HGW-Firmicutes-18]
MTKYREILRLQSQGISIRGVAASCGHSRNTIRSVLRRAEERNVSWPFEKDFSDADLQEILFPEKNVSDNRRMPDCDYIHKEMAKSGVNLTLLWDEYCQEARMYNEIPFMYTQFCRYYRKFASTQKATMHIKRKPGEQMEVDWAGTTTPMYDRETGEVMDAYLFVAVLPSSQYAYVEAFTSQNQESWITGHVNAYRHFGGVTRTLIPDNLKTGVEKASWYTPIINKTYQEMAEHYGTAVIPARVRKPKDKASVESTVNTTTTWIIAALRHQKFFTLVDLNQSIWEKLKGYNEKPFQKKPGSRLSVFLEEEKPTLMPLPATPYELAYWKTATVQFNYHISVEKMHYSVPYEYIKHRVDVRVTKNIIEVFYNTLRIASHRRLHGRIGQYSTVEDHMPDKHKSYITWNGERFISWARGIGPSTEVVVKALLASRGIEQQSYKTCMGLLKLADKYSIVRLEEACRKSLTYTPRPSLKSVQTILKTGQDRLREETDSKELPLSRQASSFGFTRGSDYYGGNKK